MPDYKIIGTDRREYGPVSAEQICQWIADGRVDAESLVHAAGGAEWKKVSEVPELAAALSPNPDAGAATGAASCPKCGEKFEAGFDSCWKCGTGRDGAPAKETRPFEEGAKAAATEGYAESCPKCGSWNVQPGKLLPVEGITPSVFRPEGTRSLDILWSSGVAFRSHQSLACLNCGMVWNYLQPGELKEFMTEHGPGGITPSGK